LTVAGEGQDRPTGAERWDLGRLLAPASVAVVGANDRPGSYSSQTLLNLEAVGYPGEVWGVNPKRREVLGRPCVPTIADLPTAVDAVVVAIPASGVASVIDQAGARGCGGAVVFSAGFAEVEEGVQRQRDVVAAARRHVMPVCGPNCNGIVAMHRRVTLWGDAFVMREPGSVALVSQSGNVAVNALATRRGLRFHTVIASGNQAVVSAADCLEALAREDGVRAIALYLEDDGGPGLCDGLAACAENGIRLAVLKVGTSPAGARAAAAHSAALAGDQRVFRSLIEEAGGIWAHDVHELLELAKTLAVPVRPPTVPGLAIMTCSGGDSAQGADETERQGTSLPRLAPSTRTRLQEILPSAATVANPLDYTAMIWGDTPALAELVRALGEDPAIGQVLVFYDQLPGVEGAAEESWRAVREGIIAGAALSPGVTIVSSTLPELLDDEAAWRFAMAGVPAAAGLRTGLRCAWAIQQPLGDALRLRQIAAAARAAARSAAGEGEWLAEHESKDLLRDRGVPVVEGRIVDGEEDAVRALTELGGSIALKLSAAVVQHKSELGGVELALGAEADVRLAHRRLAALADAHGGSVLAERMAAPGIELIVAARTGAIVPALVIGLGGIWTELRDEVAVVPLPADAARVERALRSMRAAPVLEGGRGGGAVDLGAVARLAQRTGELLIESGLEEIELNPVLASSAGAVAVDALVRPGTAVPALRR
jgi:acetate---CoA ligase (ADP-forming)